MLLFKKAKNILRYQAWIDSFRSGMGLLAELPLVQRTVDSPFDQELVAAASRYFRTVVNGTNVYQSINLFWGFRETHHGKALERKIKDLSDFQFPMPYLFFGHFLRKWSQFGH